MPYITPVVTLIPTPPEALRQSDLTRIDYSDAYHGKFYAPDAHAVSARQAAYAIFSRPPRSVVLLMALRNCIVGSLGLKTSTLTPAAADDVGCIGIFPIRVESAQQVLLGLDDKHLNFRILVAVQHGATESSVTLSTTIQIHNLFGKIYLFFVMPFHRLFSRWLLRRALQELSKPVAAPPAS